MARATVKLADTGFMHMKGAAGVLQDEVFIPEGGLWICSLAELVLTPNGTRMTQYTVLHDDYAQHELTFEAHDGAHDFREEGERRGHFRVTVAQVLGGAKDVLATVDFVWEEEQLAFLRFTDEVVRLQQNPLRAIRVLLNMTSRLADAKESLQGRVRELEQQDPTRRAVGALADAVAQLQETVRELKPQEGGGCRGVYMGRSSRTANVGSEDDSEGEST